MPICIECRNTVKQLYTSYNRADDRSLGKGVQLTQCPRCKRFADKYIEHDFVVLFIDLVLIKPQVYRHLLFNRLGRRPGDKFDPSIIRLGVLLLLFDVYLTWARIEKAFPNVGTLQSEGELLGHYPQSDNLLSSQSLLTQYMFFLLLCTLETLAFHIPLRLISTIPLPSFLIRRGKPSQTPTEHVSPTTTQAHDVSTTTSTTLLGLPPYPYPNRISTALLVSSCTKLFPMLMVIWEYDLPSSASAVSWAVIVNNVAALEILLECGYARAMLLAGVGACCRYFVGLWLLGLAGLGDAVPKWNIGWMLGADGFLTW